MPSNYSSYLTSIYTSSEAAYNDLKKLLLEVVDSDQYQRYMKLHYPLESLEDCAYQPYTASRSPAEAAELVWNIEETVPEQLDELAAVENTLDEDLITAAKSVARAFVSVSRRPPAAIQVR